MEICESIKSLIYENLPHILQLRDKKVLKEDKSYVSEGDLFCELLVKKKITEQFPDFGLVSEETPLENMDNIQKENVLILDPIDGTENFVSGLKEWGVALCYYRKGVHQQSMLLLPELNCSLMTGDKFERFDSRIAGISSSLSREDILRLDKSFEYRIIGCCVYNMYNVITGRFITFENPKGARIWDIIPGLNLALENGLSVTVNNQEYHGELLDPNQKYIFKVQNR